MSIIHSSKHKDLESLYEIPESLDALIDVLLERMENIHSKNFILQFTNITTKKNFLGFDNWQHIFHQLCIHILEKECKNIDHPLVKQQICDIITLHKTEEKDPAKWSAVELAAEAAAEAAANSVARYSVWSSVWSFVWSSAWSANSAAWSANSAADSADSAANSVAWFTRSSTKCDTYKSIADKLIELLRNEL